MAFFTDTFLKARREELLRAVSRFQYQLNGSTWKDGEINSKQVVGNAVVVYVNAPSSGQKDTITAVRVYGGYAGLFGLYLSSPRSDSYWSIGGRSAFVELPAES